MAKYIVTVDKTIDYTAEHQIEAESVEQANEMIIGMLGRLAFKINKISIEVEDVILASDFEEEEEDDDEDDDE